jgi:VanZ family protein
MSRPRLSRPWLLLGLYALLLAAASLYPSGMGLDPRLDALDRSLTPGLQNLLHVPAYAVLAGLLTAAAPRLATWPMLLPAAAIAAGYGAALELAQAAIPNRTGSVADMLLNAAGATAGAAAVAIAAARGPRREVCP